MFELKTKKSFIYSSAKNKRFLSKFSIFTRRYFCACFFSTFASFSVKKFGLFDLGVIFWINAEKGGRGKNLEKTAIHHSVWQEEHFRTDNSAPVSNTYFILKKRLFSNTTMNFHGTPKDTESVNSQKHPMQLFLHKALRETPLHHKVFSALLSRVSGYRLESARFDSLGND